MSLRTKRNFKSLQLPVPDILEAKPAPTPVLQPLLQPQPLPARRVPAGPQPHPKKRRPPPLGDGPTLPGLPPLAGARISGNGIGGHPVGSSGVGVGGPLNVNIGLGLGLTPGPDSAIGSGALHATLAKMELEPRTTQAEVEIADLKDADLRVLEELGQGNGGSVVKVEHSPTGTVMAKKIVLIDAKPSIRKQILRELQIMHSCRSPYIVSSYGAFLSEPNICICMEFMDKGSFDGIYKRIGRVSLSVVRQVAYCVLQGLRYLYDVHRIIHRDIKPSNILCNSLGEIKLCDFGVSGELINSIAHTFVGTSVYMSPERIQGAEYSVKSDVWSLGISLIEIALGRFPFSSDDTGDDDDDENDSDLDNSSDNDSDLDDLERRKRVGAEDLARTATPRDSLLSLTNNKTKRRKQRQRGSVGGAMSIIELMHQIVKEPAPRLVLPGEEEAEEFVDACLVKDPEARKTPGQLLAYPWMQQAQASTFDLRAWTASF